MSEEKKEPITDKKVSRRSMLKWTGALAVTAAVGIGAGYEANQLLRPVTTVTEMQTVTQAEEIRSIVKTDGGAFFYYTRNGRIIRIEPFTYEDAKTWTLTVNGRTLSPPRKSLVRSNYLAYRRYIYSPLRIGYPMKRVSFTPGHGGENSGDRAKGEFVRIGWAEALDLVANEFKRIKEKYGNSAFCDWAPSHGEFGSLHYTREIQRFFNCLGGNTTKQSAGHSWVGWMYGAIYEWGFVWRGGCGDGDNLVWDALQNSKVVVYWGTDKLTTSFYEGYEPELPAGQWFKELGKVTVAISPNFHDTAACMADKWIAVYPGTDCALAAGIAYTWIKEGTYDKNYLDTHTIGFDEDHLPKGAPPNTSFESYILGLGDSVPKTPEWAEKICGVPARTIRALARVWGSNPTMLECYYSGINRTAYGNEWTRMMVTLQAMQGIGKPGVGLLSWYTIPGKESLPRDLSQIPPPFYSAGGMEAVSKAKPPNPIKQVINYTLFEQSIVSPPVTWKGGASLSDHFGRDAWTEYTYPMQGYSEVKAFHFQGGSTATIPPEAGRFIRVMLNPKIEFISSVNFRWDPATKYADIILPACTGYERNDLVANTGNDLIAIYSHGIPPLFESMNDLDIYSALAKKLGFADTFTEGNTEDDWLKKLYNTTTIPLAYDVFKEKGYYVFELPDNFQPATAFRWYHDQPQGSGLDTPSGKIEIFSQTIFGQYGANNPEIPPVPKYITQWEGRYDPLTNKYPLQLLTSHPKFRLHEQFGENSWLRELYKIKGKDGYEYEPVWISSTDANARGIKQGDIVRVFNDRGQILCGAKVTEKIKPGVVQVSYGSWSDLANPKDPSSLDKGGSANLLTSNRPMSTHALIVAFNALVQIEKWGT